MSPLLPPEHLTRPEEAEALRPRGEPRRLGAFPLLGVAVRAGVPCREVPEDHWVPATDLEGRPQAVVLCPCGHRPVLHVAAGPAKCECPRWFFYTGTGVQALATPAEKNASS